METETNINGNMYIDSSLLQIRNIQPTRFAKVRFV